MSNLLIPHPSIQFWEVVRPKDLLYTNQILSKTENNFVYTSKVHQKHVRVRRRLVLKTSFTSRSRTRVTEVKEEKNHESSVSNPKTRFQVLFSRVTDCCLVHT